MNIDDLEEVREELYKLINNGMCLCNENVVEISERLDKLIIEKYES
ncbi:MAG TPA: Spo0E family sporulation regulatory protein-aspartic acid phosphatase [Clostridium sp.]